MPPRESFSPASHRSFFLFPRLALLAFAAAAIGGWPGPDARADQAAGNGFYTVTVEESRGQAGAGVFAAATGPDHPAGAGRSILFHGDASGNKHGSYVTVRSWTTGTDYLQTQALATSPNVITRLDAFAATTPLDSGLRTEYEIAAQDNLRVRSDVYVDGAGDSSAIVLRTLIINTGDLAVAVGLRYLLDFELAGDDGPTFAAGGASGFSNEEASYSATSRFRLESGSSEQRLRVFGQTSPSPDLVSFAYWPEASSAAFEYETGGRDIAAEGGANDAAVLVYFGASESNALRLTAGQSAEVSVRLAHNETVDGQRPDHPIPPPNPLSEPNQAALPVALPPTGGRP